MWAFVPSRAHSFYGLGVGDYSATWRWSYQASVVCGQTRNVNTYGCFLKKFHHSNVCARTWHLLKMCICIKIMCNLHGCHCCSSLAKCMTSNVVNLTQGNTFWVFFLGFLLCKWEIHSCDISQRVKLHLFLLDKYLPQYLHSCSPSKKWNRFKNDTLILKNSSDSFTNLKLWSRDFFLQIFIMIYFSTGKLNTC